MESLDADTIYDVPLLMHVGVAKLAATLALDASGKSRAEARAED